MPCLWDSSAKLLAVGSDQVKLECSQTLDYSLVPGRPPPRQHTLSLVFALPHAGNCLYLRRVGAPLSQPRTHRVSDFLIYKKWFQFVPYMSLESIVLNGKLHNPP